MSERPVFPVELAAVNAMTADDFVRHFADVAEHSPWVAEAAAELRPFADVPSMVAGFEAAMRSVSRDRKLALIRAHPDLAGKAANAGKVADDSRREQAGAGLDTLSEDEFARFERLNEAYKVRFDFPFILAVKGATKYQILSAFEERIRNDPETEFATALTQIARILRFRIEDRVTVHGLGEKTGKGPGETAGGSVEKLGDKAVDGRFGVRAQEMIEALARHTSDEGKLTRLYLSREHRAAADDVAAWMRQAGLQVSEDNLGTVRGYLSPNVAGRCRVLLIGSHIDTVRDGGRYDGNLGVVAGILATHGLAERGVERPFGIEVLAFGDEEGVRFPTTLLSSSAAAGQLDWRALQAADADGITVREALTRFGCDPDLAGSAAYDPKEVLGYLEVHIEQGPVLEKENLPVGIVTAIAGASRFRITIRGEAGHAGTVPMALRHDALAAASELVLAVEDIARAGVRDNLVATVGEIYAHPGAVNVIPGEVRMPLDVRAANDAARQAAIDTIRARARAIGARRGCVIGIERFHDAETAPCAPHLQTAMEQAITDIGVKPLRLMSGAGHDGQAMVKLTDIGMIFVRCRAGISHNPLEHASVEDMGTAVEVLVRTIEKLAQQERNVR
ncbi:allantoate deiminase/N-carbamoyl-L-amino-acid hydrolase [Breoghania corrubedonensis]|uniref:Allantoate deiminase/N-carbamoyl-L-amino-acid hydrolase n=1 Tax=Breoghania corrubedonensis TaxID=665038 RepID=A0A2T5V8P2_9HYPH|nr:allantoate amidohydrolase [Breoghania corrubedonensis]PTW60139.1 allantoate deiminase/N-carbamoyl-L-amino-acid hydrolase [Breoghania corrubedonensis]